MVKEYPKYLPEQRMVVQNADEKRRVLDGAELKILKSAEGDTVVGIASPTVLEAQTGQAPSKPPKAKRSRPVAVTKN